VTSPFRDALDRIPEGYSEGLFHGRRYGLQKTLHAKGKGLKLFARDLGGTDFVSLNLYRLASGDLLKPCEMPEAKVRDFVLTVRLID
jgi:peptide-methionine (S)-S-oxide reductase